jgi:hypothetical protein
MADSDFEIQDLWFYFKYRDDPLELIQDYNFVDSENTRLNYFNSLSSFMDKVYPEDNRARHCKRLQMFSKNKIYDKCANYFQLVDKFLIVGEADISRNLVVRRVRYVKPIGLEEHQNNKNWWSMRYITDVRKHLDKLIEQHQFNEVLKTGQNYIDEEL